MKTEIVEYTREVLSRRAPWIIKHLPEHATRLQEPRDLIAVALRNAGFDIYASAAKATGIMEKEHRDEFQERA